MGLPEIFCFFLYRNILINCFVHAFGFYPFFLLQEKRLCCETHLLPVHYLKMQEVIVKGIFKGTVHKKSDAYGFFKVEPAKVDLVYETVVKKLGQTDGNPLA